MKKILSLVLIIVLFMSLAIPVWATGANNDTESLAASKDKAIIIIPGLGGTSLKTSSGTIAWYSNANLGLAACGETGASVYSIVPNISGQSAHGLFGIYDELFSELSNSFGSSYDILFFAYDWRMSNSASADELEEMINSLSYQEVILVAHSMGGLVASSYLCASSNRAKVDKLITLGTPYLGSPAILHAMETGDFFPETFDYSHEGFAALIKNYPSAYQTLPPSRQFLNYVNVDSTTLSGYSETYNFVTSRSWARKADGSVKPMFATATTYHNSLVLNGSHVTELSDVDVYRLYGISEDTITKVVYENGACSGVILGNYGDGTVSYISAINNSSLKPRQHFYVSHMSLVTDPDVLDYIVSCINGTATASVNNGVEVNARGWVVGTDNRRITVIVEGSNSFLDSLDSTTIYSGEGEQVIRNKNKLYINQGDGSIKEVGTVWNVGNGSVQFSMRNGEYSFVFTTMPNNLVVEYSNSGYYERVLEYDLSNATSISLEVSDYDTKEVCCIQRTDETTAAYRLETIFAYELPEDQLYDYKNPNK